MNEKIIENKEQNISNPYLLDFYSWYAPALFKEDIPDVEKIFTAEKKVINELSDKSPCVIVGRLANFILNDHKNALHIFIDADMNAKLRRVMQREKLNKSEAKQKIQRAEKERANHCEYFFHTKWGLCGNYDISLKSNKYGIAKTVEILAELAEAKMR